MILIGWNMLTKFQNRRCKWGVYNLKNNHSCNRKHEAVPFFLHIFTFHCVGTHKNRMHSLKSYRTDIMMPSSFLSLVRKTVNVYTHTQATAIQYDPAKKERKSKMERKKDRKENKREKVTSMYQEWNFYEYLIGYRYFCVVVVFVAGVISRSMGNWAKDETRECNTSYKWA